MLLFPIEDRNSGLGKEVQGDITKVSFTGNQYADSMKDLPPSASWLLQPVKTSGNRSHMSHKAGTGSSLRRAISLFTLPPPFIEQRKNRKKLPTYSRREDKPKPQNTRQDSATSHFGF